MTSILVAINSGYVHSNLAVRQISKGSDIPFVEFNINMPFFDVAPQLYDYDILCFSCYIWNISYVLKLTEYLKKADSNKVIILGGPAVSFNARRLMSDNKYVDYVVCGEGEDILPLMISYISAGKQITADGVLCRSGNEIIGSDDYIFTDSLKCVPYQGDIVYFESSRGCPFSCTYCLSGFCGGKVRYYDIDEIKDALTLLSRMNIPVVKFVDRTFNANEKWATEILKHLLTLKGDTVWHFEIGGDLLSESLIELLNSGSFQVEIGIQSFNENTLKAVKRHCDLDRLCENIKKLTVHKHIDLIAGLPYEDMTSFKHSFNKAFSLGADMLQLGFLKVLPGSELEHNKDIVYSEYPPFRVIRTSWISQHELHILERVEKAVDIYYNKGRFTNSLKYVLSLYQSPFDLFLALADGFENKIYAPIGQKAAMENMYKVCNCVDKGVLLELLRCDYYLSGAKGNKPDFLSDIPVVVKEVRKALGIDKGTSFFITEINYQTMEKKRCAVLSDSGEIIEF